MNIFYEESGQFKVATVVQKNDANYQADTQHGKRTKVKAANVFVEFDTPLDDFLNKAQAEAADIDTDLLWEVCGEEEFTAEAIAEEYFGHAPTKTELAATLISLYAAPMYFYKKAKSVFKAAPEETLKQALAAIERKKQQEAQIESWAEALKQGQMPSEIAADLKTILHAPDKQALTYKAFTKAADALKLAPLALAMQTGGVASIPQYLYDGFEIKHFPKGIGFPDAAIPALADLPKADVQAFSIDDDSTTEVDDAISLTDLGNGSKRVGIHIAAPSLAVAPGSAIEQIIMERLSTAYFPGGKITMLPDDWIAMFSLDAGAYRPAVSIYFDIDADFNVGAPEHKIEAVYIAENLRIQTIEPHFNAETGLDAEGQAMFNHHQDLIWLYQFAVARQKARGKYEPERAPQYDYSIELNEDGSVGIARRERGSPIDTLVSEMMILANSTWAEMLDANNLPGLFRVQPGNSKVRMSTKSEPHSGMGVQHYGWFTSPLRRAADYINQKQLISLIDDTAEPLFQNNDAGLFAALRDFESAYTAYADFQRKMESYWSLVYLEQQGIKELNATLLKEDLVRINGLPLVTRATGIPFDALPKSQMLLAVTELDADKQFIALNYLKAVAPAVA
ncbi:MULTISPECIES: ribonuclease catalytic domain-containing protein [unclassified Neisseria]|uniref:ribonuclease catalytic domain-containing protein n=1 Tax=unclassified Neisseria TaxID=2623750 RepID=UPI002665688F|nr:MULTISPECIES: RNB domain-containing ribonuclease [unclassified Neisseria]MDO1509673.1 RNB domain-containing ribonuclease [Neisseria sp. MVDL19-042950]MDO1516003.1 RNB domain-containing ribonuclease [Neisseria sp. MVDL18-041461]MDO1563116.1 RNB domain-containing ribonuclease [Neisseria sp. MVDL20-010259]